MYKEKSKAEEIRSCIERKDEGLINLLLSEPEREEPRLNTNVYCPLCKNDLIEIIESSEGDSERVFFQMKCLACGCEFVLFEDDIESCRRGIENAENEIEHNKKKIEYFKTAVINKIRRFENEFKKFRFGTMQKICFSDNYNDCKIGNFKNREKFI